MLGAPIASLLLVAMPGAPSSFLLLLARMLLVAMPGAPSFLLLVPTTTWRCCFLNKDWSPQSVDRALGGGVQPTCCPSFTGPPLVQALAVGYGLSTIAPPDSEGHPFSSCKQRLMLNKSIQHHGANRGVLPVFTFSPFKPEKDFSKNNLHPPRSRRPKRTLNRCWFQDHWWNTWSLLLSRLAGRT